MHDLTGRLPIKCIKILECTFLENIGIHSYFELEFVSPDNDESFKHGVLNLKTSIKVLILHCKVFFVTFAARFYHAIGLVCIDSCI